MQRSDERCDEPKPVADRSVDGNGHGHFRISDAHYDLVTHSSISDTKCNFPGWPSRALMFREKATFVFLAVSPILQFAGTFYFSPVPCKYSKDAFRLSWRSYKEPTTGGEPSSRRLMAVVVVALVMRVSGLSLTGQSLATPAANPNVQMLGTASATPATARYVGSETCKNCHLNIFN